jgi:RimJ/RimL family protein N-acetyltransferase
MGGDRLCLFQGRHIVIVFDAERIGPWVCARAGGTWVKGRGTAIGRERNGELIAGVLYEDWNGANVVCHIAGVGNWLNRKYLWIIFDYPFRQLKVKRITTTVAQSNVVSQRFTQHLGFTLETRLKDAHPSGDLFIYRMMAAECRWLELK